MKKLNKFIALLLAVAMVIGLAACSAGGNTAPTVKDPTSDYPGYYDISNMREGEGSDDLSNTAVNGLDIDPLAMMKALGLRAFLVLEEGGKGFLHLFGEEVELTWTQTEMTIEESTIPYTWKDGVITFEQEGAMLEFTKSTEEAPKRGEVKGLDISGLVDDDKKDGPSLENKDAINFESTVLVDNDDITITATGIKYDEFWGYTIEMFLENKTDKNLRFRMETASINGVAISPMFSEEVPAGKKNNTEASFDIDDLLTEGVGDPSRIDFNISVSDSDDWSADDILSETYTIYPMGEDKASVYVRADKADDKIVVENDNFKVVVTGFDPDSFWGYSMKLYIENHTDRDLIFSMDDVSVNGYMIDPYFSVMVPAGCCGFNSADWNDDDFEKNKVETVEEIEFMLRVYYYNDWSSEDLLKETFKVNP